MLNSPVGVVTDLDGTVGLRRSRRSPAVPLYQAGRGT